MTFEVGDIVLITYQGAPIRCDRVTKVTPNHAILPDKQRFNRKTGAGIGNSNAITSTDDSIGRSMKESFLQHEKLAKVAREHIAKVRNILNDVLANGSGKDIITVSRNLPGYEDILKQNPFSTFP